MVRKENKGQSPTPRHTEPDYELIAAELLCSLRGKQSQAAFSRRIGYRSNVVSRWEAQRAFPTAARFLEVFAQVRRRQPSPLSAFFSRVPAALRDPPLKASAAAALFLRELRGRTPLVSIARESGFNRYSVSHWLNGDSEPRLPQFLRLIEVMSRRLLDFLACCGDPLRLSSVRADWLRLEALRESAYSSPWSHAVLRALELEYAPDNQEAWLIERLGISAASLAEVIAFLVKTGQITKVRGRWRPTSVVSVNTALDRTRAHALKVNWTQTALERMRAGAPGNYGYSVFAISRLDLRRLRDLHLEYVRAMQQVIAQSKPGECVGLYCAQLLDLGTNDNALSEVMP